MYVVPGLKGFSVSSSRAFHSSSVRHVEDYYSVLGVPRAATQKEIKKAYYQVNYRAFHSSNLEVSSCFRTAVLESPAVVVWRYTSSSGILVKILFNVLVLSLLLCKTEVS